MKKIVALFLLMVILLSGCGSAPEASSVTPESSQAPTSASASVESASEAARASESEPESEEESADESADTEVTFGELNGSSYANDSLGISMEIPDGWYPMSDEQRAAMMNIGAEILAGGDSAKKAALDMATQKTLVLVGATEMDPLVATSFNANLLLMAEKVDLLGAAFIKSSDDYIKATCAQLEVTDNIQGTPISYAFGDVRSADINGNEFRILPLQLQLDDGTVLMKQEYYVYFTKDYVYAAVSTFLTDDQQETLDASLGTLKID